MRRLIAILVLVVTALVIQPRDVRAGSAAGETFSTFTGPAFSATAVINLDSTDMNAGVPGKTTTAITISRGKSAGVLFFAALGGYVNGCDGTLGAETVTGEGVKDKTDKRFLGVDWLSNDAKASLLAPFGITPQEDHPLVFSDIKDAACTRIPNVEGGVWILSFSGTMQFGKKQ